MGFDDLLKKGQEFYADKDGKVDYKKVSEDAKDVYSSFSKPEDSFLDKAKSAYGEFQENHKSSDKNKEDDKEKK